MSNSGDWSVLRYVHHHNDPVHGWFYDDEAFAGEELCLGAIAENGQGELSEPSSVECIQLPSFEALVGQLDCDGLPSGENPDATDDTGSSDESDGSGDTGDVEDTDDSGDVGGTGEDDASETSGLEEEPESAGAILPGCACSLDREKAPLRSPSSCPAYFRCFVSEREALIGAKRRSKSTTRARYGTR